MKTGYMDRKYKINDPISFQMFLLFILNLF